MSESLLGQEPVRVETPATTEQSSVVPPVDTPEFLKGIDASILNEPSIRNVKDLNSLVKSYVHAQKMIGAEKVVIPSKDATPEQWNDVFKKLGLPESIDKYEVNIPQQTKMNVEFINKLKQQAYESGIFPSQFNKLVSAMDSEANAFATQAETFQQKKIEDSISGLKKEWGEGFTTKIAQAKEAVEKFGGPQLKQYLNESGLGNDPMLIKTFAEIGSKLGEGRVRDGTTAATPADLNDRLKDLMSSKAYFDVKDNAHTSTKDEVSKIMRQIHA